MRTQLGVFLTYKAAHAGVPIVQVDPAYTSQRCTACGHIDRRHRTSQAQFVCQDCGYTAEHADILGAGGARGPGDPGAVDSASSRPDSADG